MLLPKLQQLSSTCFRQIRFFSQSVRAMKPSTEVVFLGTSSSQHSRTRNHSSLVLRNDGDIYLVDCGEAVIKQFQESPLKLSKLKKIFITHMHGDHTFGLGPLLSSVLGQDSREALDPLEIYGPVGLRYFIRTMFKSTSSSLKQRYTVHELVCSRDGDRMNDYRHANEIIGRNIVHDGSDRFVNFCSDSKFKVSAALIEHSINCFGYVFEEHSKPGKANMEVLRPIFERNRKRLADIGITVPEKLINELKRGLKVKMPDSTVIQPPPFYRGRKITVLGDTYDPSNIAPLALDSNVLVHEATNAYIRKLFDTGVFKIPFLGNSNNQDARRNSIWDNGREKVRSRSSDSGSSGINSDRSLRGLERDVIPHPRTMNSGAIAVLRSCGALPNPTQKQMLTAQEYAIEAQELEKKTKSHGHSTPNMAGRFAQSIRAKYLLLNHFSSRYPGDDDENPVSQVLMRAIAHLAQEQFNGEVICARDFMCFNIPDTNQQHPQITAAKLS